MKKILFVLTSNDQLGDTGNKTGFWIEEFASPYYLLKDAGYEVGLASPKGGQSPIDPNSEADDAQTESTKRFYNDKETQEVLANTQLLSNVDQKDYDAVFYPGGHGLLWDLVEDKDSKALIESFYNNEKPVSFVCHAPAVLKHIKKASGEALVKDKKVTGFTNQEEDGVQLSEIVPFLLEDMLIDNGGVYSKIEDWQPYAVQDGLLITGQNPASSEKVARLLIKTLS